MSESVLQVLIKLFLLLENLHGNQDLSKYKANIFSYLSRFGLQVSEQQVTKTYLKCCEGILIREDAKTRMDDLIDQFCEQVENELLLNEKILIVFCLFEYSHLNNIKHQETLTIAVPIAEKCNFSKRELDYINNFVVNDDLSQFNNNRYLIVKKKDDKVEEGLEGAWVERNKPQQEGSRRMYNPEITGAFVFLYIPEFNIISFKYQGAGLYIFRNTEIRPGHFYFLENHDTIVSQGKIILNYRKIAQAVLQQDHTVSVVFSGKKLEYNPRLGTGSIKRFTFSEKSGNLIGLVSESRQDKVVLFQSLSGRFKLSHGTVSINGFDTNKDKYKLQGVIGYLPDVPLLFEELTIYENFYYHAKLNYRHIDHKQTDLLILKVLGELGLQNLQHLRWNEHTKNELGNYQTKLLNLGVELLRDPYIFLITEPFNGLQAGEIQKFISLLREICLRGKLIIATVTPPLLVNIREFDKLWIFDRKGYPIFNGKPDKVYSYFRENSKQNQNIKGFFERRRAFDFWQLISEKEVNKKGEETEIRKVPPEKWHQKYVVEIEPEIKIHGYKNVLPRNFVNIPDIDKQFALYFFRDLKTRFRKLNPYVKSVLFTVALAIITSFFGRFSGNDEYIFSENRNMLFYIFASTFNAFILGIWSGREEVRKEFRVIDRDSILLLSKYSYLNSKFLIITFISILLTGIYVIIGNSLTGIFYMSFSYWLVLSAVSISGVLIGLNISLLTCPHKSLNILLSIIIFFQLLFSGKVIPYQNFPKPFNNQKYVNILGELSVIKWGFEALTVEQFKTNKFQDDLFTIDSELSECNYEINYHLSYLDSLLKASIDLTRRENPRQELMEKLTILQTELLDFTEKEEFFPFEYIHALSVNDFTPRIASETEDYITYLQYRYYEKQQELTDARQGVIDSIGIGNYLQLKRRYYNHRIAQEVTGIQGDNPMVVENYDIVRSYDPIFHYPDSDLGRAHLYAPLKRFNGQYVDTLYFNILVILFLSSFLYVFLMAGGPEYISGWINALEKRINRIRR